MKRCSLVLTAATTTVLFAACGGSDESTLPEVRVEPTATTLVSSTSAATPATTAPDANGACLGGDWVEQMDAFYAGVMSTVAGQRCDVLG